MPANLFDKRILWIGVVLLLSSVSSIVVGQDTSLVNYYKTLLKKVDRIEVICNERHTKHVETNSKFIQIYKEQITGKNMSNSIDSAYKRGQLNFYENNRLLLQVDLLNESMIYQYKGTKIASLYSYQGDMLFLETCNAEGFNLSQ